MNFVQVDYVAKPNTVEEFGCDTKAQLDFWRPEICGVCCLKMLGDTRGRTNGLSLWKLTRDCVAEKAFVIEENGSVEGVFYRPLLQIARRYGLRGLVMYWLPLWLIRGLLILKTAPILSIDLRKFNSPLDLGRLIVIIGYDYRRHEYTVHDPTPVLSESGENMRVSADTLRRITNGRGLLVV
jgi:hypothetical protein